MDNGGEPGRGPGVDAVSARPPGSQSDDAMDSGVLPCFLRDDDTPLGHPSTRPAEEACFLSYDAEMDAEEGRLQLALLAAVPGGMQHVPLEDLRRAISELQEAGSDNCTIKRF